MEARGAPRRAGKLSCGRGGDCAGDSRAMLRAHRFCARIPQKRTKNIPCVPKKCHIFRAPPSARRRARVMGLDEFVRSLVQGHMAGDVGHVTDPYGAPLVAMWGRMRPPAPRATEIAIGVDVMTRINMRGGGDPIAPAELFKVTVGGICEHLRTEVAAAHLEDAKRADNARALGLDPNSVKPRSYFLLFFADANTMDNAPVPVEPILARDVARVSAAALPRRAAAEEADEKAGESEEEEEEDGTSPLPRARRACSSVVIMLSSSVRCRRRITRAIARFSTRCAPACIAAKTRFARPSNAMRSWCDIGVSVTGGIASPDGPPGCIARSEPKSAGRQ